MAEMIYGLIGETLKHSWSVPIHHELGCRDYRLYELKAERLILEVMDKELRAIVWLGAGLGFLMGFINCLL